MEATLSSADVWHLANEMRKMMKPHILFLGYCLLALTAHAEKEFYSIEECQAEIRALKAGLSKMDTQVWELANNGNMLRGDLDKINVQMAAFGAQAWSKETRLKEQINEAAQGQVREYNRGMACRPFSPEREAHMRASDKYADFYRDAEQRLSKALEARQEVELEAQNEKAQYAKAVEENDAKLHEAQGLIIRGNAWVSKLEDKINALRAQEALTHPIQRKDLTMP